MSQIASIYNDAEKNAPSVLFGRRFYVDQGPVELLSELLLIFFSKKYVNDSNLPDEPLPEISDIRSDFDFKYSPKYRLSLKLFSLFNNITGDFTEISSLSTRLSEIEDNLKSNINSLARSSFVKEKAIYILKELFKGFQSTGSNRDWCAQSFLPICNEMIAGESIWQNTLARKKQNKFTDINEVRKLFAHDKHDFYARGGEVLYLQLMSALNHSKSDVNTWLKQTNNPFRDMRLTEEEKDPVILRNKINKQFSKMYEKAVPSFFSAFINEFFDPDPLERADVKVTVGTIPQNAWGYGYIFAVELSRLMSSSFDIIDMIKLLELECSLHMIRTLLASSAAYLGVPYPLLPVVSLNCTNIKHKLVSNESFKYCQRMMKDALEKKGAELNNPVESKDHSQYGYKLFQKAAKSIGFVLPPKGQDEHFVISKELLVLLVSSTVLPGGDMMTYDGFLEELRIRYGIVVDNDGFTASNFQKGKIQQIYDSDTDKWFVKMLDECNYYVSLSDSLSLVKNTNIVGGLNG